MGVIRAEPARVSDWAARSIGAAWRAFDLQLAAYAALLGTIGLVMAYSNSAEQGQSLFEGGTTFVRGLMWTGIALIVFLARDRVRLQVAEDVRVAALRAPDRPARAHARDRDRGRRLRALGPDRARSSSSSASSRRS